MGVFWESNNKSGKGPQFEAQLYLVQPRGQLQPINPKRIFAQAVEGMVASGTLDLSLLRGSNDDYDPDMEEDRENIAIPGFSARIAQVSSMTKAYDGLRSRYFDPLCLAALFHSLILVCFRLDAAQFARDSSCIAWPYDRLSAMGLRAAIAVSPSSDAQD